MLCAPMPLSLSPFIIGTLMPALMHRPFQIFNVYPASVTMSGPVEDPDCTPADKLKPLKTSVIHQLKRILSQCRSGSSGRVMSEVNSAECSTSMRDFSFSSPIYDTDASAVTDQCLPNPWLKMISADPRANEVSPTPAMQSFS